MKKKILISIHPAHVKNILAGVKKYEYRKIAAKQDISSMLIYETSPTMKVVAEVEVETVLTCSPDKLWDLTHESSGVSKELFDRYFEGCKLAHAYKLGKIKIFKEPKLLSEYNIKTAPQSFVYI